jgi:hypothetical protein
MRGEQQGSAKRFDEFGEGRDCSQRITNKSDDNSKEGQATAQWEMSSVEEQSSR